MSGRLAATLTSALLVLLVAAAGRAEESPDELVEKFAKKIGAGKYEEANEYVLQAQCEDKELHAELILVANALLQRRKAMLEKARGLVGQEVALGTKTGEKKGVLQEVTDEALVLEVQIKVNRQVDRHDQDTRVVRGSVRRSRASGRLCRAGWAQVRVGSRRRDPGGGALAGPCAARS